MPPPKNHGTVADHPAAPNSPNHSIQSHKLTNQSPSKKPFDVFDDSRRSSTTSVLISPSRATLPADWYQWPVMLAILPPLLTMYYGGNVEQWSEGFLLVIVGGYLYGLVKVPWELYKYTQHRKWWHKLALMLVFLSPLAGILFLKNVVRPHVSMFSHWVDAFPVALYVLTAYIRPLMHLFRVMKYQAQQYDEVYEQFEALMRDGDSRRDLFERLKRLESQMTEMQMHVQALSGQSDQQAVYTRKMLRRERRHFDQQLDAVVDRLGSVEKSVKLQRNSETNLNDNENNHRRSLSGNNSQNSRNLSGLDNLWWPVRLAVTLTTWWIPLTIKKRLLPFGVRHDDAFVSMQEPLPIQRRQLGASKQRASITMGETGDVHQPHHGDIVSASADTICGMIGDSTEPLSSLGESVSELHLNHSSPHHSRESVVGK